MRDVVTELAPAALARGQRGATLIEPVETIDADRDMLHQIAVNLVESRECIGSSRRSGSTEPNPVVRPSLRRSTDVG